MKPSEQKRFDHLYQRHLRALKLRGFSKSTIDVHSRAVRRVAAHYKCCPDQLTVAQLEVYFAKLVDSHSWSTVKVDRNGLQFFYEHVLGKQWDWVDIVKPPQVKTLPDILTIKEVERVINNTRELRYQTFILVTYSMGLRIGEALNLRVADIDSERMKVHVRLGKGKKDRFVTLPQPTLLALRRYWCTHRNPTWIFPHGRSSEERLRARQPMDRGGLQKSFKVIVADTGITKHITPHSLRHCYGAHLVEAGLNLRAIQHEMGHECPKTTALYTQLTEVTVQKTEAVINKLIGRLNVHLDGEL